VIMDFLEVARDRLTDKGVIYLLLIDQNMPLLPKLAQTFGFQSGFTVLLKREVTDER